MSWDGGGGRPLTFLVAPVDEQDAVRVMDRSLDHAEWITEIQWHWPTLYRSKGFRAVTRFVKHKQVTIWPRIARLPRLSVSCYPGALSPGVWQGRLASAPTLVVAPGGVVFVKGCEAWLYASRVPRFGRGVVCGALVCLFSVACFLRRVGCSFALLRSFVKPAQRRLLIGPRAVHPALASCLRPRIYGVVGLQRPHTMSTGTGGSLAGCTSDPYCPSFSRSRCLLISSFRTRVAESRYSWVLGCRPWVLGVGLCRRYVMNVEYLGQS